MSTICQRISIWKIQYVFLPMFGSANGSTAPTGNLPTLILFNLIHNLGPQTAFSISEGILNHEGDNHIYSIDNVGIE